MKRTSLILADDCLAELKRIAHEDNLTTSDLVNGILQRAIAERRRKKLVSRKLTLPTFSMGAEALNLSDRDELENALKETD